MNNRHRVALEAALYLAGLSLTALTAAGARAAGPDAPQTKPLQRQASNGATGLLHAPFDAAAAKAAQQRWAKELKREVVETNSIGMKLTLIPPGEFLMGSPNDEFLRDSNEMQHRVRITKPFSMGVYDVTLGNYLTFYHASVSKTDAQPDGYTFLHWGHKQTNEDPVVVVSWKDAQAFCQWLSKKEGKKYRLPSEAEWEYACRAGTTTPFYFGSALNGREANCNGRYPYGTKENGPNIRNTTPVGSYKPNAFGLCDMSGNVDQWCQDWYDVNYYANSPIDDPRGPSTGFFRVIRGGDWLEFSFHCRSAYRFENLPAGGRDYVGFRVVREP